MIRPRQLGSAFVRHVESYGQLAAAAARDLRDIGRRRAMLAAAGLVLAIALVTLAGATAIAAGWNTAWRWWVAGGVLAAFALATFACLSAAMAAMPGSTHLQALRDEWQKDKAWLSSRERERERERRTSGVRVPTAIPEGGRRSTIDAPAATLHDA